MKQCFTDVCQLAIDYVSSYYSVYKNHDDKMGHCAAEACIP